MVYTAGVTKHEMDNIGSELDELKVSSSVFFRISVFSSGSARAYPFVAKCDGQEMGCPQGVGGDTAVSSATNTD